jgi:hypothetical protein
MLMDLASPRPRRRVFGMWSHLLLAIRGHPDHAGPTVGNIADYLVLRHHSAVELINRAAADGLVKRTPDVNGHGVVRVTLTSAATDKLDSLAETHLQELAHLAPTMQTLWQHLQAGTAPASLRGARK